MRYAMIMAGGAGKRLWPMSREKMPKQLLPMFNGRSLLELAAARVENLVEREHQLICTNEEHRPLIHERLPNFTDAQILGEPVGRDTVNAVGFTAAVLHKRDPDAVFAVLTADHLIEPVEEFQAKLRTGFDLVEDDATRFVTFSIQPTYPATGYGYVERGESINRFNDAFIAKRFVEKPDESTAQQYIKSGNFGWNSGMFVFHAGSFLDALEKFKPDARTKLGRIADAWGTSNQQQMLDEIYPTLKATSVDFAVMEPASTDNRFQVCTIKMNIKWTDVGSWPSFGSTLEPVNGNRTNTVTEHIKSSNVLTVSDDPNHLIATIGCDDLIIVRTQDVTLVCRADQAERVKELVERVDPSYQ